MKNIQFLIKPASSLCNLRCRYCFYADVAENRELANMGLMSEETAERLIASAFEAAEPRAVISFAFQGGEPTLAGLNFFYFFVETVRRLRPTGVQVSYSIQTNGSCIDEAWANFFRDNHFLVGVSVDGDRVLHDSNRVDAGKKGTYQRVTEAIRLLQKKQVDVNLLCVVTGQCARHAQKVYGALKKLNTPYLQFIPCLDPLEEERGNRPFSLKPEAYGSFLCWLFDLWYRDWEAGNYVSVRLFEDYVHLAMGLPAGTCSTSGKCSGYFVVEGDGGLYPCDFYVLDDWNAGRIGETSLDAAFSGETYQRFVAEGEEKPAECASCRWKPLCNGGCKRDWVKDRNGDSHNYFCLAFQQFFAYAGERIRHVAQAELRLREQMSRHSEIRL